jgi:hypothetical protein
MRKRLRSRLTYSNVIASIALFVALGGAAVAAGLPKNSVGPRQLKKGAVTAAKIRKGAVSAGKLAPKSVVAGKLGPNAVTPGNIVNGGITTAKIGAGAVIASSIKNSVITTNKLNNDAVTTAKLAAGAVTTSTLANGAVTAAKLGPEVLGTISTLKPGQTLRGTFDIGGRSGGAQGQSSERWSESFPIPLVNPPAATEANILKAGQSTTACPGLKGGNLQTPEAAAGQLCVYLTKELEYEDSNFDTESVNRLGFGLIVSFGAEPEKDHYLKGFWAVTAP